jgi:hypothetical protein
MKTFSIYSFKLLLLGSLCTSGFEKAEAQITRQNALNMASTAMSAAAAFSGVTSPAAPFASPIVGAVGAFSTAVGTTNFTCPATAVESCQRVARAAGGFTEGDGVPERVLNCATAVVAVPGEVLVGIGAVAASGVADGVKGIGKGCLCVCSFVGDLLPF